MFALSAAVAAALFASSTGFVAVGFIESDFIESMDVVDDVDDVVGDVDVDGVIDDVDDGAGIGAVLVAGAGITAGAGAGAGAGGGVGSFLPHAASATTIIDASNNLFIWTIPSRWIGNGVWLVDNFLGKSAGEYSWTVSARPRRGASNECTAILAPAEPRGDYARQHPSAG